MTDRDNRDNRNERDTSATDLGKHNQQLGRELYERDKQQQQQPYHQDRYARRGDDQSTWGEGNYFHTGPSPRGAQDRPEHHRAGSHPAYPTSQGARLGNRYDSPYRNENAYLNYGSRPFSGQGYYHEPPAQDNPWQEGPDTRTRYKETDYRYGSGTHNWYQEGRYSPDEPRHVQPTSDRGFFQRLRHTWDDIMHSDDPEWQERDQRNRAQYVRQHPMSERDRHGSEPYRDRNFNRGYEGGPRWADETDSGKK